MHDVYPEKVTMEKARSGGFERQLRSVFPEATIERVETLEYGDDPGIEPGMTALRVFVNRAGRPESDEADLEVMRAFEESYSAEMRAMLNVLPPAIGWVEFIPGGPLRASRPQGPKIRTAVSGTDSETPGELTSVMTRLGPTDLAVVDTLITAGIATSRAEVLRWALGRIRQHPAYAQLQTRVHEIEEIKALF